MDCHGPQEIRLSLKSEDQSSWKCWMARREEEIKDPLSYIPILNEKAEFLLLNLWTLFSIGIPQRGPTLIVVQ